MNSIIANTLIRSGYQKTDYWVRIAKLAESVSSKDVEIVLLKAKLAESEVESESLSKKLENSDTYFKY